MNALLWILHPLVCYVLLTLGLGLSAYLFVTLKAEMRGLLQRRVEDLRKVKALETNLEEARRTVQVLETDLREVERQTGMLVAPSPTRSGLNLSKRTQVLRMHRVGQDTASIAAALALPRAEVELLEKVHRIVVEQL